MGSFVGKNNVDIQLGKVVYCKQKTIIKPYFIITPVIKFDIFHKEKKQFTRTGSTLPIYIRTSAKYHCVTLKVGVF